MKKIFLILTLIAALAPRSAQGTNDDGFEIALDYYFSTQEINFIGDLLMLALENQNNIEKIRLERIRLIVNKLVINGVDINTIQNNNGDTPLMQAINSAPNVDPEIFRQQLEILFEAEANPHVTNNAGQNVFDLAQNLPHEHSIIFKETALNYLGNASSETEKLLPFLRAFEIQEQ